MQNILKKIFYIAQKEFQYFFYKPMGSIVIFFFLFISGIFFFSYINYYSINSYQLLQSSFQNNYFNVNEIILKPMMSNLHLIFLILIPLITMRVISEEKKTGNWDLLLSYPVSPGWVVCGKFLGSVSISLLFLLFTLVYPFGLYFIFDVNISLVIVFYIGLWGMVLFYNALGLFFSSLNGSQSITALMTYLMITFFFLIEWSLSVFSSLDYLKYRLGIFYRLEEALNGILSFNNIFFMYGLVFLLIYFTILLIHRRKNWLFFLGLYLILFLVITQVTYHHDFYINFKKNIQSDEKDKIIHLLKKTKKKIHFIAFTNELGKKYISDFFHSLDRELNNIHYEIINPDLYPDKASQYQITNYNSLTLQLEKKIIRVGNFDIESIYQGVSDLLSVESKQILFVSENHQLSYKNQEENGYSQFKSLFDLDNVRFIDDFAKKTILDSIELMIIIGDITQTNTLPLSMIKEYISNSGIVLWLITPPMSSQAFTFLKQYGSEIQERIIFDETNRANQMEETILSIQASRQFNKLFFKFQGNLVFPLAYPVEILNKQSFSLLETSSDCYIGMNQTDKTKFHVSSFYQNENKGKLVLFANINFLNNTYLNFGENSFFIKNLILKLLNRVDNTQPLARKQNKLMKMGINLKLFFIIYVIIIPFSALLLGLVFIYYRKRNRKRLP